MKKLEKKHTVYLIAKTRDDSKSIQMKQTVTGVYQTSTKLRNGTAITKHDLIFVLANSFDSEKEAKEYLSKINNVIKRIMELTIKQNSKSINDSWFDD